MAIRSKEYLRDKFKQGAIPTGQDFADLIQTIISQINDKNADENGTVITDFRVIDPMGPDALPSTFPLGTSEFITSFKKEDYSDYIAENPSISQVPDGMLAVRTFKDSDGMCFQEVDTIADGKFNASFYRLCIDEHDSWGELSLGTATEALMDKVLDFRNSEFFEVDENKNVTLRTDNIANQISDGVTLSVNENGKLVASGIGEKGDKGDTGDMGEPGPQGEKGETGPQGPPGPQGATGARGPIGNQGSAGPIGPIGPIGPQGPKGEDGADGEEGPPGPQGLQGIQGPAGPQGQRGATGERGQGFEISGRFDSVSSAETILQNEEGLIFYIIQSNDEAENGKVYLWDSNEKISIFQFQSTGLKGDKGDEGAEGPAGPAGMQGPQGERGITGPIGPQGIQGQQGIRGLKGEDGTSINLLGTLAGGAQLPNTANHGDTYWRGYTLFTWSDNKPGGPGFIEGFNLRGLPGEQGPQGPQGIRGEKGDTPEIPLKEYFFAQCLSNAITLNNSATFTNNTISRGIAFNNTNGTFTLNAGKVYEITYGVGVTFTLNTNQTNGFATFRIGSSTTNLITTQAVALKAGSSYTNNPASNASVIIAPTSNTTYRMYLVNTSNNGTYSLRGAETFISIKEI